MGNWVSVAYGLSLVYLDLNWGSQCVILADAELFQGPGNILELQLVHLGRAVILAFA